MVDKNATLNIAIQGTETRTAALDVLVQGTTSKTATLSVTTQGGETRSASLDILTLTTLSQSADLSVTLAGTENRTSSLSVAVSDARHSDLEVLVQGQEQATTSLSAAIQGGETRATDLDMVVGEALPHRYMRQRGHLSTRYFGGGSSDANFFEGFEPLPAATVTSGIGTFTDAFRGVRYQGLNTIPTGGTYDKYSVLLNVPLAEAVGNRLIVAFRPTMPQNGSLVFGLFNDQLDPAASIAAGAAAFELGTVSGHPTTRAWYGGGSSFLALPVTPNVVNRPYVLELEVTSIGTLEARLFDRDKDLDVPLVAHVVTGTGPTVDRFSISSFGRETPGSGAEDNACVVEYVDVERGSGSPYTPDPSAGIALLEAKWRPFQGRAPITLLKAGTNEIRVALTDDSLTPTLEALASVELDTADPIITVNEFITDSAITVPGSVTPPIVKGSLQPGFSGVAIKWEATRAGTYSLRANSTSVTDGVEIQQGPYPLANTEVTTAWDFADLPGPDGIYDVTLYVIADTGRPTAKKIGVFIL